MQTKIKSILAILLIFATTISCDNYLDLRPEDGIVRAEFWRTKEDVQSAVIGIYSSLLKSPPKALIPTGGTDYTISEYLFMFGEMRGDMVIPGPNVTADQRDISNSNILPSNDLTSWHAFYRVINFCNTVIDLAPGVLEKDPTLTKAQLNNYLSEALAIRAYMYFTLARTFRDVPLKLTATLSDTDNFQIPSSSQDEVFAQVIKDLALAEEYAVKDYGINASNKGRITVYTINAMQADVYLWMEKYSEAIVAANKVIDSGKFKLIPASNTWYSTVYAKGNSSESIFEFQFTTANLNPFYDMLSARPEFTASSKVLEEIFGIDFNDALNKDIRGERASLIPGTNEIYKFTGLNNDDRKSLQESDTHWFVYRYADVLLLKAEALAETGKGDEALAIIQEIRTARKAISLTVQNPNPTTKSLVIDYILAERAREFAFEGKRWFDVLRNAKRNKYARLDILLNMALSNAPADQQQSILAKLKDPNSHYLPINIYDLYTNKTLVQNPFYK
ncbi:RagB/SusD family nutrient uptake outer membrane protein [Flavobacterium gilvum]|uniref:RagB/SusD family nutrient uptake outer membrane protein n=1 Tax=Flavobacterium gilvum TaxID=1492737 RepID=A0AAC9I6N8_9FLAO|nr:RagB/SusD family nutrient uptake outer membrane protein [Flavobacterium gilvum]AOW09933.1 RagB/SusD family nutrient uptake outer membrane protein [Flavobacterium gilvum]KFC59609.1 membrane protein [Flavobacterium gilvum]